MYFAIYMLSKFARGGKSILKMYVSSCRISIRSSLVGKSICESCFYLHVLTLICTPSAHQVVYI